MLCLTDCFIDVKSSSFTDSSYRLENRQTILRLQLERDELVKP